MFLESRVRPVRRTDNLTAICDSFVDGIICTWRFVKSLGLSLLIQLLYMESEMRRYKLNLVSDIKGET
jgi:hypothetical protein